MRETDGEGGLGYLAGLVSARDRAIAPVGDAERGDGHPYRDEVEIAPAGDAEGGDGLPYRYDVEIAHLLASPLHRYEGRPGDGPRPVPTGAPEEARQRIELRAHLGVVGDRHFGHAAHRTASVTVMAIESVEHVERVLGLAASLDPYATRRNILLRGVDADLLKKARFSLDSGAGAVEFEGHRPANPCAWMDVMLAPGAHQALRGRGGVRCEPLTSGTLEVGRAVLRSSIALEANGAVLF